jgi:8-oxo-dGTP pyrophosphatase MutT (NUDIX family)
MTLARALAHPQISLLSASLRDTPGAPTSPEGIGAWAAVAVILRAVEQGAELLFIRRVERNSDTWSGQVALPGGRQDESDPSLLETAVRETWEEIGVDLGVGARLGVLDDVAPRTPVLPPIAVRPFVFAVPAETAATGGAEVAEAFWVPLDLLCDRSRRVETPVDAGGVVMTVQAIRYGEHVIWGMTHRIVLQIVARLEADGRLRLQD